MSNINKHILLGSRCLERKNDSVVFAWHFRNYDCCVLDNQITQKGSLSG